MKIQNALVSNIFDWSQRYFAHVTTVTLSWRVQNIVVIGRVYFTLECFEFSSNFEFDRNMLSGTGAWHLHEPRAQQRWVPARPSLPGDKGQLAGRSGLDGTQAHSPNRGILSSYCCQFLLVLTSMSLSDSRYWGGDEGSLSLLLSRAVGAVVGMWGRCVNVVRWLFCQVRLCFWRLLSWVFMSRWCLFWGCDVIHQRVCRICSGDVI